MAAPPPGIEKFRSHVAAATAAADRHLIAAYSRKQFLQTGAGKANRLTALRVEGLKAALCTHPGLHTLLTQRYGCRA